MAGGAVTLVATTRCEVRANYQHGLRWGVGIMIVGGADHVVSENECRDDLCAIRLTEHRRHTRRPQPHRNPVVGDSRARRPRLRVGLQPGVAHDAAVDVEGATASGNVIERQLAEHCDTGLMVERGAAGTRVGRFVVP